jgi:tripartite-type tricarboxylate transporter receptor subunit TctC
VTALLGGHVDAVLAPLASLESHLGAGTLRLLATTSANRLDKYPNVPTFTELGVDSTLELWVGIVAPKKIEPSRLSFLRDKFAQIAKDPQYIQAMDKLGVTRAYAPGDEFEKMVRVEYGEFKELVQELGLAKKK